MSKINSHNPATCFNRLLTRRKDKTSLCHGLTMWTICFVDIVVSYDFFVLLCGELIFSLSFYCLIVLSTTDDGE